MKTQENFKENRNKSLFHFVSVNDKACDLVLCKNDKKKIEQSARENGNRIQMIHGLFVNIMSNYELKQ